MYPADTGPAGSDTSHPLFLFNFSVYYNIVKGVVGKKINFFTFYRVDREGAGKSRRWSLVSRGGERGISV
jgi:hypothetical protein